MGRGPYLRPACHPVGDVVRRACARHAASPSAEWGPGPMAAAGSRDEAVIHNNANVGGFR
jgi:hypothetical protein